MTPERLPQRKKRRPFVAAMSLVLGLSLSSFACSSSQKKYAEIPEGSSETLLGDELLFFEEEVFSWELSWKGVLVGHIEMATGRQGEVEGKRALLFKSQARRSDLTSFFGNSGEEVSSIVNLDNGLPISTTTIDTEDGKVDHVESFFDASGVRSRWRPASGEQVQWSRQLDEEVGRIHDRHTMMALLRAWQPEQEKGSVGYFYMQDGRSFYRVTVVSAGSETLNLKELGKVPSLRIDGEARRLTQEGKVKSQPGQEVVRRFVMWVGKDERRLPVQLRSETRFGDAFAKMHAAVHESSKALIVKPADKNKPQ